MTGLHCWAKVRLLRVSRSLQDTKVSWGNFYQKYLIQSPLAPLGHRSTCRDRRRGSWTSRKRFLGGKLSWGWCWGLVVAPLHSLFGSKASRRCRRYCCSHLAMIHYGRVEWEWMQRKKIQTLEVWYLDFKSHLMVTAKRQMIYYLQPGLQRPSDISAWQVSMWMYCSNG